MTKESSSSPSFNPKRLRQTLGAFATGVTIITTLDNDRNPQGLTANSFTSVSLEPPLILVCIGKSSSNYELFTKTPHFAVNILAEEQRGLSKNFARSKTDKFANLNWYEGITGSPLLEECAAKLDCRVHQRLEVGDHLILIGEVADYEYTQRSPLIFHQGSYLDAALSQEIIPDPKQKVLVGAIIEHQNKLLFIKEGENRYALPLASRPNQSDKINKLLLHLERYGVYAYLNFIYDLFDNEEGNQVVYYRGYLTKEPDNLQQIAWFSYEEIPWDKLESGVIQTMLKRYVKEQQTFQNLPF